MSNEYASYVQYTPSAKQISMEVAELTIVLQDPGYPTNPMYGRVAAVNISRVFHTGTWIEKNGLIQCSVHLHTDKTGAEFANGLQLPPDFSGGFSFEIPKENLDGHIVRFIIGDRIIDINLRVILEQD